MSSSATTRLSILASIGQPSMNAGERTQETRQFSEGSDESIMIRVQEGDSDALAMLFGRYARLVRVVSIRILRDEAEADDLVQELFLFVHREAGVCDLSKSTVRSWIVQMTYRRAISRWRYLNARGHYKNWKLDGYIAGMAALATPTYDSSIEALFGREGLKKVMRDLTAEQHETLRLYFYEGYTLAEIGKKLGQSQGYVRHHYYRGLEKLRKQMPESKLQNC
jgi:RNA polymerase sigma-70 factor (ECF subfamily)